MSLAQRIPGQCAALLHRLVGSRAGNRLGILVYHRVQDNVTGLSAAPFSVPPAQFRKQLCGLLDRGFTFWPLTRVLDHHKRQHPLPPRVAVVTFDDCYESVYHHAWPILRELNVPATLFLATAYLDSTEPFPFDPWGMKHQGELSAAMYRPLTVNQCREMAASGLVEMASHTHTHEDFRGQYDALRDDIRKSVASLREEFGVELPTFAFPFGRRHLGFSGGAMADAAREAGVQCALTTDCALIDALSDDPFAWGRFNAYEHDTSATLAAKLSGWYAWAPQLQVALHHLRRHVFHRPALSAMKHGNVYSPVSTTLKKENSASFV